MSHDSLIEDIADLADKAEVAWCYWPDSRKLWGHSGFPDLILCGSHHMICREVKLAYDTLSPEQTQWRYRLTGASVDWGTWRPCDLRSGRIRQEIDDLNKP